jgi:hypothetical protein
VLFMPSLRTCTLALVIEIDSFSSAHWKLNQHDAQRDMVLTRPNLKSGVITAIAYMIDARMHGISARGRLSHLRSICVLSNIQHFFK